MHTETFLREFAPLASGPGGVQKLRELVLQLALNGRLVDDESAQYGWREYRIDDIATCYTGNSISAAEKSQRYKGLKEGLDYIATKDVEGWHGGINYETGVKVPFDEVKFKIAPAGSVLICAEGGSAGRKIGVLEKDVNFGNKLICCVPVSDVVCQKYIFRVFQSPAFHAAFKSEMTGIIGGISLSKFKSLLIRAPGLQLQQEIVAKVDKLMELCDELEARQTKENELKRMAAASALHHLTEAETPEETVDRWSLFVPRFGELFDDLETIKGLRATVLNLAINGRCGTFDESDDDAPEALRRIVSDIAWTDGKKAKYNSPGLDISSECAATWATAELGQIIRISSGDGLTAANMAENGTVPVFGGNGINGYHDQANVDEATLVIGRVGFYCGSVHATPQHAWVTDNAFVVRYPKTEIDFWFLHWLLKATNLKEKDSATAQPVISGKKVYPLKVDLPPLAEQKRIVAKIDELMALCDRLEEKVREGEQLDADLMAALIHALTETDPDGGGGVETVGLQKPASEAAATKQANRETPARPETESALIPLRPEPGVQTAPDRSPSIDTKFQEAVLVAAIVDTFFQAGGEPIGNFRLQKGVYFARRKMGEHVGEMAYLKKAAGPYNPSMKYSGGIAIAKQKSWLREARGRFGFGHVPGQDASDAAGWIDTYGYSEPARWVAEHFRFKKNDEWEALATVDYAVEHLRSLDIDPDAEQILQYITSDPEWHPKIEKLGLTEMSVGTAMLEVAALFNPEGEDESV
jgi:type I restriction enzyme S subunit